MGLGSRSEEEGINVIRVEQPASVRLRARAHPSLAASPLVARCLAHLEWQRNQGKDTHACIKMAPPWRRRP